MKTFLTLALIQLIMIPLFSVSADDHVPGDDIFEIPIHGTVLDNATGLPLIDVSIYAFDENYKDYYKDLTNGEGSFYFEVKTPGFYHLVANKEGYEKRSFIIRANFNGHSIDFAMDPVEYDFTIHGEVEDQESHDLIPNVTVTLEEWVVPGVFTPRRDLRTNETGGFSFNIKNGLYRLVFEKEDYYTDYFLFDTSGNGLHLRKTMRAYYRGVRGVVKDSSGSPIEGATLCLRDDDEVYYETTGETGEYEILIPYGGDYTLTCYADGYRPEGKPVRVQGSIVEIDIHMEEPRIPLIYQFLYLILELLGSIG